MEVHDLFVAMALKLIHRYKNHNQSAPMKTTLHFALDRSGVVTLERAEQVVEVSEWVEVVDPIRNITALLANLTANETTGDVNATTGTEESESKPETDAGNLTDENVTATEVTPPPVTVTKKLRKRIFRIPLKVKTQKNALECDPTRLWVFPIKRFILNQGVWCILKGLSDVAMTFHYIVKVALQ